MMLLPNLYQLCGHAYGSHQNVYAAAFPESRTLVQFDTGLDETDLDIILQNLSDWGLSEYRISHVFLTHSHFDHTGNAHYFAAQGAQILIGGPDADAVLARGGANNDPGNISFAYGKPFPATPVHRTLTNQDSLSVQSLSICCHSVPGHTPGCMAYSFKWCGKHILVTGDFLQTGDTVFTPQLGVRVDERYSYEDYRSSLKKMSTFPCDVILPGHFQPCMKDAHVLLGAGYREILVNRNKYGTF